VTALAAPRYSLDRAEWSGRSPGFQWARERAAGEGHAAAGKLPKSSQLVFIDPVSLPKPVLSLALLRENNNAIARF
jgi:hypothetical protein